MPKVTDEYRNARRAEIAEAALRAFRRKGFQATSMADIIAESGLSAGAIYGHFASKADIVLDSATRIVGARILDVEDFARIEPMPPPSEMIAMLMRGVRDELGDPGVLIQVWGEAVTDPQLRELTIGIFTRLRDAHTRYIALWHTRENGLSPEAAEALAAEQAPLFVAAGQGFILQSTLLDDFDAEGYLERTTRYLPR